jgi:hypothetical protein
MSKAVKTLAAIGAGGAFGGLGAMAGCESWLEPSVQRPAAVQETASDLGLQLSPTDTPSIDQAEEEVEYLKHRLVQIAEDAEFVIARYDAALTEAREIYEQRRAVLDNVFGALTPAIQAAGEAVPGGSFILPAIAAAGLFGGGLLTTGPGQKKKKDADKEIQTEREKARKEGITEGAALARGSA